MRKSLFVLFFMIFGFFLPNNKALAYGPFVLPIHDNSVQINGGAWNYSSSCTVLYEKREVTMQEEPAVVDRLVAQYERLFGRASREVCKEAVRDIIGDVPQDKVPAALK